MQIAAALGIGRSGSCQKKTRNVHRKHRPSWSPPFGISGLFCFLSFDVFGGANYSFF